LPPEATVFYRFHPLYRQRFTTLERSRGHAGQITLRIAAHQTLSVPQWMLNSDAEQFDLSLSAQIPAAVLLDVVALLDAAYPVGVDPTDPREPAHEATDPLAR
jgi:hypothetical protein